MKKLYLLFLMLLIMFIPVTHSVAVYQLDQPIQELNNHTLREVFEDFNLVVNGNFNNGTTGWVTDVGNTISTIYEYGSYSMLVVNTAGNDFFNINQSISITSNHKFYISLNVFNNVGDNMQLEVYSIPTDNHLSTVLLNNGLFNHYSSIFIKSIDNSTVTVFAAIDTLSSQSGSISFKDIKLINQTLLGIEYLSVHQMDMYYNLYLEAVRFEQENIEASQDNGGYQNIFKSIIEGVKNLMQEMGNVWNFLNAPILTDDMNNYRPPDIDWSWDIIGVVRQILNNANVLAFQMLFIVPSLIYSLLGIPIHISLLSLLFSNLIFLLLGWIVVKSFII